MVSVSTKFDFFKLMCFLYSKIRNLSTANKDYQHSKVMHFIINFIFLCYEIKYFNKQNIFFSHQPKQWKKKFILLSLFNYRLFGNAKKIQNRHQIIFIFKYETYDIKIILSIISFLILNDKITILLNEDAKVLSSSVMFIYTISI